MLLDLRNSIDVKRARAYLDNLIEKGAKVELKKVPQIRTLKQNAFLHVCLGYFCAETGFTIDEAKEIFSRELPDMMRYEKNGSHFRKSTAELDTKEMTILIDKIREVALDQLGLYIPTSQEYLENKFRIERDLELMGVRV